MQKWRNWEAAGEADWLLALKRESVIGPLAAQAKLGVQRVDEAALELGLGRSVVYDLLKRYRQRSQTSSLLPGKRGREPKVSVLGQDREDLLSSYIQDVLSEAGATTTRGSCLGGSASICRKKLAGPELPHRT